MSDVVIRAEGLGKKYTIGHQSEKERYYALRDVMARNVKNLWKGAKDLWSGNPVIQGAELEEFWALKDVSFEIKQGEAVGIIGRNGAGKSTLLKVLSRITEPSAGKVTIKGRVASLLEVGTGFHPELTGRENIFLNGAILGMSRKEIKSKFDEIVDFAEIEKFLDTPVKRYSSGMYVRLAFAVAAHLEPEILLVDEVLAVGDADFQKKCLGKMEQVSHQGRTVLFVSHNMGMITALCSRVMLLKNGYMSLDGISEEVVGYYYSPGLGVHCEVDFTKPDGRMLGDELATLLKAHLEDEEGNLTGTVDIYSSFRVKMIYRVNRATHFPACPNFHFYNSLGQCVFVSSPENWDKNQVDQGQYEASCHVPGNLLNNDTYFIGLALTFFHRGIHVSFFERGALHVVVVEDIDKRLANNQMRYTGPIPGIIRPKLNWEIRKLA